MNTHHRHPPFKRTSVCKGALATAIAVGFLGIQGLAQAEVTIEPVASNPTAQAATPSTSAPAAAGAQEATGAAPAATVATPAPAPVAAPASATKETAPAQAPCAQQPATKEAPAPAAAATQPVKPPPTSAAGRNVELDTPTKPQPQTKPQSSPEVNATPPDARPQPVVQTQSTQITAQWLAQLGKTMLQSGSKASSGQQNQVVSPVSLASALGLVHEGTTGASANELSDMLAPAPARQAAFQQHIPALLKELLSDSGTLVSANRIWADAALAKALPATYLSSVRNRFDADGALVSFAAKQGQEATEQINAWAAKHTNGRIPSLLSPGSVNENTQVVLTNALHFRSAWSTAFEPHATQPKPFMGASQPVPTMSQYMEVKTSTKGKVTVYDIDFKAAQFSFTVAMEQSGHTGSEVIGLVSTQKPRDWTQQWCTLEMPKFKVAPTSTSLKPLLQALNVKTVFGDDADFTPLLGSEGRKVNLDDVYQSAGVDVQEAGVEAAAATAAVIRSRAMILPSGVMCAIDRPFVFAITHKPTGTPVFLGRVVKP